MAKTKILNKTPMQPRPKLTCPKCGKEHYSPQVTIEPSARTLCDKCFREFREECRKKGTYC